MIFYVTTSRGASTVRRFLTSRGKRLSPFFVALRYEALFARRELPRGAYVFADLERLSDEALAHAERVYALLDGAEGVALHNRPGVCALKERFQPLLHAEGINDFTSWPAMRLPRTIRYPVFLRYQKRHEGPASPLLHDEAQLARAYGELELRGADLAHHAVVEYVETLQPDGYRRFFSGYLVGGRIVIRYTLTTKPWVQKTWDEVTPAMVAEETRYVREKPHEAWMRRVFALARIDYGRLDFSLGANGRLQAWEINTNPGFIRLPEDYPPELAEVTAYIGAEFEEAWRSMDVASSLPPIPVPWEPPTFGNGGRVTPPTRLRGWRSLRALLRVPGLRGLAADRYGRRALARARAAAPTAATTGNSTPTAPLDDERRLA